MLSRLQLASGVEIIRLREQNKIKKVALGIFPRMQKDQNKILFQIYKLSKERLINMKKSAIGIIISMLIVVLSGCGYRHSFSEL